MLLLDYERGASPLYSQIMREEKRKIVEGEYLFGQVVPSEKDMEEMYHVSRITVRQAIQGLERDGYVKRIRGKGTQVVYRHQIEEMLLSINSFSEEMRERGMEPEDAASDLRITAFPMKADGTPDLANLKFEPPKEKWNVQDATPVIKGRTRLDDAAEAWRPATEANKADLRFFRVEVELP